MKIADLFREKKPVSFEIFPPKGELSMESFRQTLSALSLLSPDYISVTCSAGGSGGRERTAELAGIIRREYGVESCAHLTCVNSDVQMLREDVRKLHENGVENVLALRGDVIPGAQTRVFRFASELMRHLRDEGFCLGGACYPEGHIECGDPEEDLRHLYEKQQAGASFLVTQLFFDNACFYRFIEKARKLGITIPVTPGIMPILSKAQIERMIFTCGASLPSDIIRILYRYENDPDGLRKAGIDYAVRQIRDLQANGADGIHIYTMNRPQIATEIMEGLR
ncbi:MAG: methylenetetrahydrofolate reductase [Clostridia bacterium]|nr:methylenetetrahydrofolate reductase [Clostridia bacterium]